MKKILAIDGGGVKGIIPAAMLQVFDEECNHKIQDYFDLIIGTSTGGIIAAGLGLGFTSEKIVSIYKGLGPTVFQPLNWLESIINKFYSLYKPENLRTALEEHFNGRRLGHSSKRLVIPSFSAASGETYIYKTPHHPGFKRDYKKPLIDVLMATSAAPSYLPAHRYKGLPLLDGGIWANNPSLFGIVEGISWLNWAPSEIKVLSLGCSQELFDIKNRKRKTYWLKKSPLLFMRGQTKGAIGGSESLIGRDNYVRINPKVPPGKYDLASSEKMDEMDGLGREFGRDNLNDVLKDFLTETAEPYEPEYTLEQPVKS